MRRWFAILLLLFLPLKFSWAAVAIYCAHETDAAASSHGHHDHAGHSHASKDADPGHEGAKDGKPSTAIKLRCAHCLGVCDGMVDIASSFEPQAFASAPSPHSASRSAEHVPARPERPQWAALA